MTCSLLFVFLLSVAQQFSVGLFLRPVITCPTLLLEICFCFTLQHRKRSEIMPKEDGFKIHSWLFVSGFVVVSSWSLVEEVSDSDQ